MRRRIFGGRSLRPVIFLLSDRASNDICETMLTIDELKKAFGDRDKILRMPIRIGDELIPELRTFVSKNENKQMIYDVSEDGHINEYPDLRDILFYHCNRCYHHPIDWTDDDIVQVMSIQDIDWEE